MKLLGDTRLSRQQLRIVSSFHVVIFILFIDREENRCYGYTLPLSVPLSVDVAVRRRTVVDSRDYSCNKEQVQSLWRILYTSCGFLNALKYIFDELFQIVKTETLIYTQNMGSKPPECIFTEIDCISLHVTGFTLNLHWFSLRCTSLQY